MPIVSKCKLIRLVFYKNKHNPLEIVSIANSEDLYTNKKLYVQHSWA